MSEHNLSSFLRSKLKQFHDFFNKRKEDELKVKTLDLYYKMIFLGSECVGCGVYYEDIKQELLKDNSISDEEITNFLFYWFDKVYMHEAKCKVNRGFIKDKMDYNRHHLKVCKHYLSAEAVIQLHQFESASSDRTINMVAIWTAVVIFAISSFLEKCTTSSTDKRLDSIEEVISTKLPKLDTNTAKIETLIQQNKKAQSVDSSFYKYLHDNLQPYIDR